MQKKDQVVLEENSILTSGIPFDSEEMERQRQFVPGIMVLTPDDWSVLGTCLRWTMLLCRKIEKDQQLTLGFCVTRELHAPLAAAIQGAYRSLETNLRAALLEEQWVTTHLRVEGSPEQLNESRQVSLTSSAVRLYDLVHALMRNIKKVLSPNYPTTEGL